MQDKLSQRLKAIEQHAKNRREKHIADVRYVQEHYPALAEFLTEFSQAFGRDGFTYRAVFRETDGN